MPAGATLRRLSDLETSKEACEKSIAAIVADDRYYVDKIEAELVVRYPRRDGRSGVREDDVNLGADSLRAMGKIDLTLDCHNPS